MEEDILKYLPTVMFRGTPCNFEVFCHRPFVMQYFDSRRFVKLPDFKP